MYSQKGSKHGIMLKTGRSEKDLFTVFSVNLKLFQSKRLYLKTNILQIRIKLKFNTRDNSRKGIFKEVIAEYFPGLIKRQVLSLKEHFEHEAG